MTDDTNFAHMAFSVLRLRHKNREAGGGAKIINDA